MATFRTENAYQGNLERTGFDLGLAQEDEMNLHSPADSSATFPAVLALLVKCQTISLFKYVQQYGKAADETMGMQFDFGFEWA